ncbi:GGDEF domain-containing protein [Malaciobacter pacificus]|uniref:PAS sensor-containing diguanylate cyclase/phosphodiesterase n=1 Tax=Malaciobacter pacificus TaxID=1080223 RepID=A0A5C2H778_9BACT|nr:GGDEF domain-containing phosphodiesterase [Malaciobacter pacificus]QEP34078.1 PAS sensor-containing diguanylate cyclase/phosphodiesterase [Malaciobacter pacificus]GGD40248.1 GGDEF domain-containing protein [Malaciobacter pacificus]
MKSEDSIDDLKKQIALLKNENYKLNQYKSAIEESNIVSIGDLKGNIVYVNEKFCDCTLYSKEEVLNQPHSILKGDTPKEVFAQMWETIQNKQTWHGVLKNKRKNGDFYYINVTIKPILDLNGELLEYIAIRHEITDLVNKSEELEKNLRCDFLTNEGNRFKLLEDIQKSHKPALALFDINKFGELNDFYGHEIGDEVLKTVSSFFRALIPSNYFLYRIYSDEFAILADGIEKDEFIQVVKTINDKISSSPIIIRKKELYIQTTYSISFEDKSIIKKTANMIKKYVKIDKSSNIYDKRLGLEKIYEKNVLWTLKLKKALDNNKIVPFFQAIYNMRTQKIEKYEVLVRLINEENIPISPYYFLDIAKRSKQYIKLTKTVVEKSFEYFQDKNYEFSVNLTIEDIINENVANYIIEKIKEYNIGSKVIFEIVESEGINNFEEANDFIDKVKSLGAKVAIDDFGSGYSNFNYLIKLKADFIKIDGSLINDIHINKNNKAIVETILDFAKKQKFKTIAEFVSSQEIYDEVKSLAFDYAQGYLIGEPKKEIIT